MSHFVQTVFVITVLFLSSAQSGASCSRDSSRKALVVIDMQPVYIWRNGFEILPGNSQKAEALFVEIEKSLRFAMASNWPIAFVTYEEQGPVASRLTEVTAHYEDVTFLVKNSDGLFNGSNRYHRNAERFIEQKEIGTLIVTGANGGACVQQTIVGALSQNCAVEAYTPAIADFNEAEFIYPYSGYYTSILNQCMGCKLNEVTDLNLL